MKIIFWTVFSLLLIFLAAWGVFYGRFSRQVAALEARVGAAPPPVIRSDLPDEVRALGLRGMAGGDPAAAFTFRQDAEMELKPGQGWKPLTARQISSATEPGFVWLGEMRVGPLPIVRVIDKYVTGEGRLDIRMLGAFRMGVYQGHEADLAEAYRYLAELPFMPDAIMTNPEIVWEVLPDGIAASMETNGGVARVEFGFDAAGDAVRMIAHGRPATQPDGSTAPMEWHGTFGDYEMQGGRYIPTFAEVGYVWDDGYLPYYRGRILDYRPAASSAN